MVRTRSRAFIQAAEEENFSDPENDAVEQHVARRHARLEELAKGSDSDSEGAPIGNQVVEREVLDIDISSSEDEADISNENKSPLHAPDASRLYASDEDGEDEEEEEDTNWGGRRRKYHGADTGEHEIMEEEERDEALREEEDEALRLQRKALAQLEPSDYGVGDDDDEDDDNVVSSEGEDEANLDVRPGNLAEVGALAVELKKYYELLQVWRERLDWGKLANTRFHLYAAYTTNIVYYFALLSDPESANLDTHEHPVLRRIVDLRTLINQHETIPINGPEESPPASPGVENTTEKVIAHVSEDLPEYYRFEEKVVMKARKKKKNRNNGLKIVRATKNTESGMVVGKDAMFDENLVDTLLSERNSASAVGDVYSGPSAAEKRRRLNRITGRLESEAKNASRRRIQSADTDHIREPRAPKTTAMAENRDGLGMENREQEIEGLGDEEFVGHLLKKTKKEESRKRTRKEDATPHVYTFDDNVDVESRRRASTQVVLNRGLTRYRPKEKKTPRTKNKLAYANAMKRHKTVSRQVVDVKPGVSYGGEATGINMNARRGASLSKF